MYKQVWPWSSSFLRNHISFEDRILFLSLSLSLSLSPPLSFPFVEGSASFLQSKVHGGVVPVGSRPAVIGGQTAVCVFVYMCVFVYVRVCVCVCVSCLPPRARRPCGSRSFFFLLRPPAATLICPPR